MAKLFASDTAMSVTTDAVQLFGGAGYTKDFPVERMMRDAKVTQIYESSPEGSWTSAHSSFWRQKPAPGRRFVTPKRSCGLP
jgi:hypothetical protein